MTLTFKLFASLTQYLPPGADDHRVVITVPENASPNQVLERHGVPIPQVHLVLVNGIFVPPSERDNPLRDGDELAVWPAVAGG